MWLTEPIFSIFLPLLEIPGPAAEPPDTVSVPWLPAGSPHHEGNRHPALWHPSGQEEDCWAQHKSMGKPLISFAGRICSYRNTKTHRLQPGKNFLPIMLSTLTSISTCCIKTVHSKLRIFRWQKGSWVNRQCQGYLWSLDYFTSTGVPRRLHRIQRDLNLILERAKHSFCSTFCI